MGAKKRIGIGLSYRPAKLHYIGWPNRFLIPFLLGIRNRVVSVITTPRNYAYLARIARNYA